MTEEQPEGMIELGKDRVVEGMHKVADFIRPEQKSEIKKMEDKGKEIAKDAAKAHETHITTRYEPGFEKNQDVCGSEIYPQQDWVIEYKVNKAHQLEADEKCIEAEKQNIKEERPMSPLNKAREKIAEGIQKVAEFIKPEEQSIADKKQNKGHEKSTTERIQNRVNEICMQAASTIEVEAEKLQESNEPQSTIDSAREKIADTMEAAAKKVRRG